MSQRPTVGAGQLFCTLFVCRLLALFTFFTAQGAGVSPENRPLVFLPYFLMLTALWIPVFLVTGKNGAETLLGRAGRVHPALKKGCALLYAGGAVWSAGVGFARFRLFMDTVLFPGENTLTLLGLTLVSGVLIARRGLQALLRVGTLVFALTAASLLFVCVSVCRYFDVANLAPPLQNGALPLLREGFDCVVRTGEAAALTALAPQVKGGIKKGAVLWGAAVGLTLSALSTLSLGVMGAYGERQTFLLYALTVLARFGVIERPDAAVSAVWVLCSLTRVAFSLYIAGVFLEQGFGLRASALVYAGLSAPVLAVCLALTRTLSSFANAADAGFNGLLFVTLLVLAPAAVLSAERIHFNRKKRADRKNAPGAQPGAPAFPQ